MLLNLQNLYLLCYALEPRTSEYKYVIQIGKLWSFVHGDWLECIHGYFRGFGCWTVRNAFSGKFDWSGKFGNVCHNVQGLVLFIDSLCRLYSGVRV